MPSSVGILGGNLGYKTAVGSGFHNHATMTTTATNPAGGLSGDPLAEQRAMVQSRRSLRFKF